MNRSTGLRRKPFPVALFDDGKPRWSSLPARSTEMPRGTGLRPAKFAVVEGGSAAPVLEIAPRQSRRRTSRPETGFPRAVKLDVRKRAGEGEADRARCEACGQWLGRYAGQVQHRAARGMGGSPSANTIVNAALLCGTPYEGCHGTAEARDDDMNRRGWWLKNGQDPALTPVTLHTGAEVWLTPEGGYAYEAPDGGAVA